MKMMFKDLDEFKQAERAAFQEFISAELQGNAETLDVLYGTVTPNKELSTAMAKLFLVKEKEII